MVIPGDNALLLTGLEGAPVSTDQGKKEKA
jgi:hypothetical protein